MNTLHHVLAQSRHHLGATGVIGRVSWVSRVQEERIHSIICANSLHLCFKMISGAVADFRSLFCCCLRSRFSAAKAFGQNPFSFALLRTLLRWMPDIYAPRIRSRGSPDVVVIRNNLGHGFIR